MAAVSPVSSSSEAQTELVKYQQKLAADLAAKAAERVITADRDALDKARQAAQAQQPATAAQSQAATAGPRLDVTV